MGTARVPQCDVTGRLGKSVKRYEIWIVPINDKGQYTVEEDGETIIAEYASEPADLAPRGVKRVQKHIESALKPLPSYQAELDAADLEAITIADATALANDPALQQAEVAGVEDAKLAQQAKADSHEKPGN